MIVCHCKGISDRQLREVVAAGATTRRKLARACGAGAACGGCRPVIDEILGEACAACPEAGAPSLAGLALSPAR
jgi:bacterioferritin-associated ferredoxin